MSLLVVGCGQTPGTGPAFGTGGPQGGTEDTSYVTTVPGTGGGSSADASTQDGGSDSTDDSGGSTGGEELPWPVPDDAWYVDATLAAGCSDYDPEVRACGGGTNEAYTTIADAAAVAGPGDTVVIREGTYAEPLIPANSGSQGLPVVFRSYPDEVPVLSGPQLSPAINLEGRTYIHLYGLEVRDVPRWLRGFGVSNVTVERCRFVNATDAGSGAKAGIDLRHGERNRVINSSLENNPADSLTLIDSHYNIIEGNSMIGGGHALFAVRGSSYNIFRDNYFYNADQKIGEFYDLSNYPDTPDAIDATRYNLIEDNEFAFVPSSGDASPFSGIQYAGQAGIIRRNRFYDTVGPGIRMSLYGTEATFNTDNRIYHNVFAASDFAGVDFSGGGPGFTMTNNVLVNNVFSDSVFVANDTRWSWWVNTLAGKSIQIKTGRLDGFLLDTNCIYGGAGAEPWLITYGWRDPVWGQQETIAWWEANQAAVIANTLVVDPQLDADHRPLDTSPLIDAGRFLTTTVGSGESATVPVADASYFYDGYGIEGEVGDRVQLASGATARVVTVDRSANTLTLDAAVAWSGGEGISLAFEGAGPDIGVFEVQ